MWHEGLLYKLRSVVVSRELHNLGNHLSERFQRAFLNEQNLSWWPVLAGVPQGSILGPLLFLVYINDLPNELKSTVKLYVDDTSLFTIVRSKNESVNILHNDLFSVSKWAYNWKMLFIPDPSKPTQEVLFSRKEKVQIHLATSLSNIHIERASYQKHLGILLHENSVSSNILIVLSWT